MSNQRYAMMLEDLGGVFRGLQVIKQQHNSLATQRTIGTSRVLTKTIRRQIDSEEQMKAME